MSPEQREKVMASEIAAAQKIRDEYDLELEALRARYSRRMRGPCQRVLDVLQARLRTPVRLVCYNGSNWLNDGYRHVRNYRTLWDTWMVDQKDGEKTERRDMLRMRSRFPEPATLHAILMIADDEIDPGPVTPRMKPRKLPPGVVSKPLKRRS